MTAGLLLYSEFGIRRSQFVARSGKTTRGLYILQVCTCLAAAPYAQEMPRQFRPGTTGVCEDSGFAGGFGCSAAGMFRVLSFCAICRLGLTWMGKLPVSSALRRRLWSCRARTPHADGNPIEVGHCPFLLMYLAQQKNIIAADKLPSCPGPARLL